MRAVHFEGLPSPLPMVSCDAMLRDRISGANFIPSHRSGGRNKVAPWLALDSIMPSFHARKVCAPPQAKFSPLIGRRPIQGISGLHQVSPWSEEHFVRSVKTLERAISFSSSWEAGVFLLTMPRSRCVVPQLHLNSLGML